MHGSGSSIPGTVKSLPQHQTILPYVLYLERERENNNDYTVYVYMIIFIGIEGWKNGCSDAQIACFSPLLGL